MCSSGTSRCSSSGAHKNSIKAYPAGTIYTNCTAWRPGDGLNDPRLINSCFLTQGVIAKSNDPPGPDKHHSYTLNEVSDSSFHDKCMVNPDS